MKILKCTYSPINPDTGKPEFALTVGKKYEFYYNYDPIGWRVETDNGRQEVFFNTNVCFIKRRYHFNRFLGVYTPSQTSSILEIGIKVNGFKNSIWLEEEGNLLTMGRHGYVYAKLPAYFVQELKMIMWNHIDSGRGFGFYEYNQKGERRYGDDLKYTYKDEITNSFFKWAKSK